jgi:ABC-2 type transport system ATP-binding protein
MASKTERNDYMGALAECNGISKSYGKRTVIQNMNLKLEGGKIIGLLGPNGSGKTTLIKILSGVLNVNSGDVKIDKLSVGIETKKIVSYLPERTYFLPSMKVKETLDFFEDFYEDFNREKAVEMLEKLDIPINARIKELSKGTREKVQLVLVMSREAKLYLLDEPMGGVDPAARDYILRTILSSYNPEASIIISTHLISDVEKILDEVIFIKNGEVVMQETVDNIRNTHKKSVDSLFREVFAC